MMTYGNFNEIRICVRSLSKMRLFVTKGSSRGQHFLNSAIWLAVSLLYSTPNAIASALYASWLMFPEQLGSTLHLLLRRRSHSNSRSDFEDIKDILKFMGENKMTLRWFLQRTLTTPV